MSNFAGVTFTKQAVSPSDDAIVRRALLSDGILTGCAFTYSGSTLTMAAGHLMVCGRQIKHPASQNWAVVDATSGFARLVLTIDMTRTATKDTFDQVVDSIEYASAVDGFVNLEQADINGSGTRYQVAACVVSLGAGGITGIVSQLERSEGGGAGLNFSVVGSEAQPSGPKENMIWAITSEPVTGWIFAAEPPAEPERGMLFIQTGTTSVVAFNAIKKNGIELYPISAKQYTGNSWVDVTCKTYQNEEWVDWWNPTYLFKSGEGEVVKFTQVTEANSRIDVSKTRVSISRSAGAAETSCYMTTDKIDLAEFGTLSARVKISDLGAEESRRPALGVGSSPAKASANTKTFFDGAYTMFTVSENEYVVSVDVSRLNSAYYVGINGAMIGDIFDIWLE